MFANVHILKAKQNEDRKYIICLLTLKVVKLLFDQSIHGKTLKKFQNSMSANPEVTYILESKINQTLER